jgi:arabinofuranosyltransferase
MPGRRLLLVLSGGFFLVVLLRTAWLSELSYWTLRTIEHAANGHGLRWNAVERVQTYDHPLWMLVLLAGRRFTGESYFTTLVISAVLSVSTVLLVLSRAKSDAMIALGAALLSLSWAFVTYSTSGLEGPLVHLLLAAFALTWLAAPDEAKASSRATRLRSSYGAAAPKLAGSSGKRRREALPEHAYWLALLAGLAAFTHPATLLITFLPLVAAMRILDRREGITVVALSLGPPVLWTTFAFWYYGLPVPLALFGGLAQHVPLADRVAAALRFVGTTLQRDPVTVAAIAAGVIAAWPNPRDRRLALGVVVYLGVLALWCGDAMTGRWCAAPLLVATIVLIERWAMSHRRAMVGAIAAMILALVAGRPTFASNVDVAVSDPPGDGARRDERVTDYPATGLLLDIRQRWPPVHPETTRGGVAWKDTHRVRSSPNPAYFGFAAGYGVYVIDRTGRADPLLAWLPPDDETSFPGAALRSIPPGYEWSLPDKANHVEDANLAAFYDRVRFVTRGPLTDWRRIPAALTLMASRGPAGAR